MVEGWSRDNSLYYYFTMPLLYSKQQWFLNANATNMATVPKHSLLASLSGGLGKEIVFKQYRDKTVVSKYPDMSRIKPTELQKQQRKLMKEANAYASKVKRDPRLRAAYEKKLKPGESVFHKAKQDFFKQVKKEQR